MLSLAKRESVEVGASVRLGRKLHPRAALGGPLEESLLLPLELAGRQRKLRPASGPLRPLSRNEGPLKLVPPKLAGVLPGAVPAEDELRG
jgi:hypothetical protein